MSYSLNATDENCYPGTTVLINKLGITDEKIFETIMPDFKYKDYIPFSSIMVDVKDKSKVDEVKETIEDKVENAKAIINVEDTSSYVAYQGEIDEGKTYVGVFSGIFLFIAMLSVITTMTRVVKNQRTQIGTLKALGFSNRRILQRLQEGINMAKEIKNGADARVALEAGVNKLADTDSKVCTLGPIIHNKEMVSELKSKGHS